MSCQNFMPYHYSFFFNGGFILPPGCTATLNFTSSADDINQAIISEKNTCTPIFLYNNHSSSTITPSFTITNTSACPKRYLVSDFYYNFDANTWNPSNLRLTIHSKYCASFGFNDGGGDSDFNDMVVNITICCQNTPS